MKCVPCKSLTKLLAERRAYFDGARDDIASLNLLACLIVNVAALVQALLYAFVLIATDLHRDGASLVFAYVPVFIVALAASAVAFERRDLRLAKPLSLFSAAIAFVFALVVDVLLNRNDLGTLMPMACVAIPSLFIVPARQGVPLVLGVSAAYALASWGLKAPDLFEGDMTRLFFALLCSVLVAELATRSRVRHFRTGMRYLEDSLYDDLSRVFNRQGAFEAIKRHLDASPAGSLCALAVVDIDEFKSVNDDLGHLVGDMAIRRVAEALDRATAEGDVVGRFGGDEFVVFLKNADEERLRDVFESAKRAASLAIEPESGRRLSCSIGVCLSKGQRVELADAFVQADRALYVAKKSGRDRMVVVPYVPEGSGEDLGMGLLRDPQTNEFLHRLLGADTGLVTFDGEGEVPVGKAPAGEGDGRSVADRAASGDGPYRGDVADTVLIVDDEEINRAILGNLFCDLYEVEEASDGSEAISKILSKPRKYCAVLLDVLMDGMDGLQTLECLQRAGMTTIVPVFVITADARDQVTRRAYELGAIDVISKPVVPYIARRRVESVAELFRVRARLGYVVEGQHLELTRQTERIVELTRGMVEALSTAIEFRDNDSGDHVNRIYDVVKLMLLRTDLGKGLSVEEIDSISLAAIMHDVGKIGIPDSILNKPGKLTPEEFAVMKTHTVQGELLLSRITQLRSSAVYDYALDIARHHHERWDGSGYPDGLVGDQISKWAQVVALADVYDALTNERRYKRAYSHEKAMEMILNGECGVFNPEMLERFKAIAPDIAKLNSVAGAGARVAAGDGDARSAASEERGNAR